MTYFFDTFDLLGLLNFPQIMFLKSNPSLDFFCFNQENLMFTKFRCCIKLRSQINLRRLWRSKLCFMINWVIDGVAVNLLRHPGLDGDCNGDPSLLSLLPKKRKLVSYLFFCNWSCTGITKIPWQWCSTHSDIAGQSRIINCATQKFWRRFGFHALFFPLVFKYEQQKSISSFWCSSNFFWKS